MFGMGGTELLIIGGLALLVFGPGQIPKFARGIGDAVREFRKVKDAGREVVTTIQKEVTGGDKQT